MIVQPNFLDHWKTRLLQTELGDDPMAHTYVLRLWGHCQEQKRHRFNDLSESALAAICCYKGAPKSLFTALKNAKFISEKGTTISVHQWNEYNSGLITSWKNGKKGGRPKKPKDNPRVSRGQPASNPLKTDREDKIDKIDNTHTGQKSPAAPMVGKSSFQLRADTLFRKRPETPWDRAEQTAWRTAKPAVEATTEEQWKALEWWFALPGSKAQFRRRNLATLLNNWNSEIIRAETEKKKESGSTTFKLG